MFLDNLTRITATLHEDRYTFLSHLPQLFLEWEISETKVVEDTKTHFCVQQRFLENRALYEVKWKKHCRAGQVTDGKMAHAHCMLDT
jgi:hypothetical protein